MTAHALPRVRTRSRRRRPPGSRELLLVLTLAGMFSQTAWSTISLLHGNWGAALSLIVAPFLVAVLRRLIEVNRYWERQGRPLPTDIADWFVVSGLWLVQAVEWMVLL